MRRKIIAASAVLAAGIAGLTYSTVQAQADTEPTTETEAAATLPAPTGDHQVGTTTLHLTDADRADPWVPEEKRELMVSMWYPARQASDQVAPYMTTEESRLFMEKQGTDLPADVLSTIPTHSTVDAKPIKAKHVLPLVVLSPGFTFPRATLTGLAEDLASRGYVVAAIGHNYEATGTTFPDGHTTTCTACEARDGAKVVAGRAADTSFVIDSLTAKHSKWKGAELIDADHIAMAGHSIGGASAFPALLTDSRVEAGINMDGTFHHPEGDTVDKPFMMLGQPSHAPGGEDESWDRGWTELTGEKYWLSVDDTSHSSFTDLSPISGQLGQPIQKLDGERCLELTREYVGAFLDTALRGDDSPLLDGPTDANPEVNFHNP